MRSVEKAELKGKIVFLRPDYNLPIKKGRILDDRKISQTFPTIDYLLKHGAKKIIIGTHLGRPEGKVDSKLSTKPIADYLAKKYPLEKVRVLENLRFDSREEKNNPQFAQELAKMANLYVNDAFAVCHRKAASTCAITKFLPSYAGLLLKKEIKELSRILKNPGRPLVIIIGGAKIETKLGLIKNLEKIADKILVGGMIANHAIKQNLNLPEKVILPLDGIKDKKGINRDIGPQTIAEWQKIIKTAQTIFWNGNLGMTENRKFRQGSKKISRAIAESKAKIKIVGGGDTTNFLDRLQLAPKMTFISTAGGAALEFLAGEKLPGLEALNAHYH